jgi:hypothetical protein
VADVWWHAPCQGQVWDSGREYAFDKRWIGRAFTPSEPRAGGAWSNEPIMVKARTEEAAWEALTRAVAEWRDKMGARDIGRQNRLNAETRAL